MQGQHLETLTLALSTGVSVRARRGLGSSEALLGDFLPP